MTFTREQLIEHAKRRLNYSRCGCRVSDSDRALDEALMETALAALESRADADQHIRREVNAGGNTWVQCSNAAFEKAKSDGKHVRELYERPQPAPVVVHIPPEKPHTDGLLADGWNACRAAMLQGKAEPVSQPYTLRGWIPCSERMPAKGQEVLCTDQFENYETALYDTGYIPGPPFFATTAGEFHPTHWMPLPAPPL
ncbi:DUF551 domain-containing protein [Atlantibacter hermannii]|uniref:DUF551 domain-containing protein n=1 Tax=Atlantibacter hermannii TaxID=565 RepID=UPI0013EF12D4|nr:DUF551 domain-containing protein [Atlantibacter hermannii]